jgi:hypothetical protein
VSTYAISLPRAATGGPKFDKDRVVRIARDWWDDCRQIMQAACPFIPVPSPVREALAGINP